MTLFAILFSSVAAMACPQFHLNNASCTDNTGETTQIPMMALLGSTIHFTAPNGQSFQQTIPYSNTSETGEISSVRCEGDRVIITNTFKEHTVQQVATFTNGELRTVGQSLVLGCQGTACDRNEYSLIRIDEHHEVCR